MSPKHIEIQILKLTHLTFFLTVHQLNSQVLLVITVHVSPQQIHCVPILSAKLANVPFIPITWFMKPPKVMSH